MTEIHYENKNIPEKIKKDFRIPDDESYTVTHFPYLGAILVLKDDEHTNEFGPQAYSVLKGILTWSIDGKYHRSGGPAFIDSTKGILKWYAGGKLIRQEKIETTEAKNLMAEYIS